MLSRQLKSEAGFYAAMRRLLCTLSEPIQEAIMDEVLDIQTHSRYHVVNMSWMRGDTPISPSREPLVKAIGILDKYLYNALRLPEVLQEQKEAVLQHIRQTREAMIQAVLQGHELQSCLLMADELLKAVEFEHSAFLGLHAALCAPRGEFL